jgi:hypothetical protein
MVSKVLGQFASHPTMKYLSANVGGHGGGSSSIEAGLHPNLKRQFWEHTFIKGDNSVTPWTASEIQAGLELAEDNGIVEVYFGNHSPENPADPERDLVEYKGPGLGNLQVFADWAAAGRTPKALWYMWPASHRGYLAFRPEVCKPLA